METISQDFLQHLTNFHSLLVDIAEKKKTVILTLKELGVLQSVKSLLDQERFLNMVYSENAEIRKFFSKKNMNNTNLEEEIYVNVDQKIKTFLNDIGGNLDSLRIQILNKELNAKTAIDFLKILSIITTKHEEFLIMEKDHNNEDDCIFFSTNEQINNGKNKFETLNILYEFTKKKKASTHSILFEINDFPAEIEKEIFPLNGDKKESVLVTAVEDGGSEFFIYFFKSIGESRLLYENVDAEIVKLIATLFKGMVLNIQEDIFSKYYMCNVLDDIKNSLLGKAKDICLEILKNELREKLNTEIQVIQKGSAEFQAYLNSTKGMYNLVIKEGNIIIPIIEFEQLAFLISIDDLDLDVHTFIDQLSKKWSFVCNEIQSLRERYVFLQVFEQNPSSLLLLFSSSLSLIYQNREIPLSLKNRMNPMRNNIKLSEIFIKDADWLYLLDENLSFLNSNPKSCRISNSNPTYEIIVKRNDKFDIQYIVLHIQNEKRKSMARLGDEPLLLQNKNKKPLDDKKMEKYTKFIAKYLKLEKKFEFKEIASILLEKDREFKFKAMLPMKAFSENKDSGEKSFISEFSKDTGGNEQSPPRFHRRTKDKKVSNVLINTEKFIKRKKEKTSTLIGFDRRNSKRKSTTKVQSNFSLAAIPAGEHTPNIISYDMLEQNEDDKLFNFKENLSNLTSQEVENLNNWDWNVLAEQNEYIKFNKIWMMFHSFNYFEKYEIEEDIFNNFLVIVREKYNWRKNPFHNFDHGITVCHNIYYILKTRRLNSYLVELEQFALLLAALCHDIDHSGRTNAFEVNSYSNLALKYNDESVLENHHSALTFKILCEERYNILCNLEEADWKYLRKYMISNILHTDMKKHFESLGQFDAKLDEFMANPEALFNNEPGKKLICGTIIHACDLYTSTKTPSVAQQWVLRINQEFSSQVRDEEKMGLPVTPYYKNLHINAIMAKQEIQFIKVIQRPLWEKVNKFLEGAMDEQLINAEKNVKYWENVVEEEVKS